MEIGAIPAGVVITLLSTPLTWLWLRQNRMAALLEKTYNKDETEKLIDLKQKPMQDSLDRNTKAVEEMTKLLTEVRLELAGARSHDKESTGS